MTKQDEDEINEVTIRSQGLVARMMPILAGNDPGTQGVALADLLAVWLVCHEPNMREEVLTNFLELMRDLLSVNEKLMFDDKGHPAAQKNGRTRTDFLIRVLDCVANKADTIAE